MVFPIRLAAIEQVPTESNVRVVVEMLQVEGVRLVRSTVRPDDDEAVSENGAVPKA